MSVTAEGRDGDEGEVGFDAEMVERRARIFRFGHFPTKGDGGWTCTREQFVAFNGESGTVPIGVDPVRRKHYLREKSIFDGRTGEAAFRVEGEEVYATLRTPAMVMDSAVEHGMKISSVFRSATDKTLTKVDLVDTPHFEDAVIFAAGAGEVVVFEDDEPDEPEGPEAVEFSGHGHEAYQTMHDLSSHGRPGLCSGKVGFAREVKESDDDRLLRQMHHHAVHMGAYCPGMPDGIDHEEIAMSDELDEEVEAIEEPDEVAFTAADIREMRAEIARLRGDNVREKAIAFTREVTTGADARVLPGLRKKIEEVYTQAADADAAMPEPVTFTEGVAPRQGSRVDAFKSLILALPKLGIAGPKVSGVATEVAFTALDLEPAEGAEHQKREDERREERRKLNRRAMGRTAPAE